MKKYQSPDFDWSTQYRGGLAWLPYNTIYLTKHGSHAYGTNIATSDLDIRGIAFGPREHYLGLNYKFEQAEQSEPDLVIYEITKILKLASDANPNVIEILFTESEDKLFVAPSGQQILDIREKFLSKKVYYTFVNYAISQMRRIETHRKWLFNPPQKQPQREDFGLPPDGCLIPKHQLDAVFSAIRKQLDSWAWKDLNDIDPVDRMLIKVAFEERLLDIVKWSYDDLGDKLWEAAVKNLGFETNFLEYLAKERNFKSATSEWTSYQNWTKNRNSVRSELERKFGFDTKHGLQLHRLLSMGEEILSEGRVEVKRRNVKELLGIRNGEWSFDKLSSWFEDKKLSVKEALDKSPLPKDSDKTAINELCMKLIYDHIK
jgi:hypothetical protein